MEEGGHLVGDEGVGVGTGAGGVTIGRAGGRRAVEAEVEAMEGEI